MIAVSMSHKAYAFSWSAFERSELRGVLLGALSADDPAQLVRYINEHRCDLKDPYEGSPLPEAWQDTLANRDVHEYGDFALTRFYDPAGDCGIGDQWRDIDGRLTEADRAVLLGTPLGPPNRYFDPGRLGSYFQTPRQVVRSLARVRRFNLAALEDRQRESLKRFEGLLAECVDTGLGLYVTF
jgi:hypothetical protein